MGSTHSIEKPAIETLCNQIILAKADSQFSTIEPVIIATLKNIGKQIEDPGLKDSILLSLKEGRKGIPSLIFCMMWKGSAVTNKASEEKFGKEPQFDENNEVRKQAFKTFYKILSADKSMYRFLFDQELIGPINKICLAGKVEFKQIGVKILNFLTSIEECYSELKAFNPLYTMNSLLISRPESVNPEIRKLALRGIENLAKLCKSEFVINGVIGTLLNILHENNEQGEISIVMDCFAKSADEDSVAKNLIEENFSHLIDRFLNNPSLEVRISTAACVDGLCRLEAGRDIINKSTLKLLHELCKVPEEALRMRAKSALLNLCLNERQLNYFTHKKWVDEIMDTFNELKTEANRDRVIKIIEQLSKDCLKYTLYHLYLALTKPLIILVQDKNDEIRSLALTSMVNLTVRLDLQPEYSQVAEILIKQFDKMKRMSDRVKAMTILSVLSITNQNLINESFYTNFFFSKADRSNYPFLESDEPNITESEFNKTEKKIEEQKEDIENMVKLARITCISFPSGEVQTIMNEKLKLISSQCRSMNQKIRYRAVGTLAVLASRDNLRHILHNNEFFETITLMLSDPADEVKLAACMAIKSMLLSPDGIKLWLKFDSSFVIDSSNNHTLAVAVSNKPLSKHSGLYLNWGKEFFKSETVIIPKFPPLKEWTISVWFRTPLPPGDKILVQGKSGTGAIIGANDDYFYAIDKKTGTELLLWKGLKGLTRKWNHLCVTLDSQKRILARVNNGQTRDQKAIDLEECFKYFMNSKKGKNPFGVVCDFRVYGRFMNAKEIEELSNYNENVVFALPDKYCEYANVADIPTSLIHIVEKERNVIRIGALQALTCLATKSSCRASMLRNSIIKIIVGLIRSVNTNISKYSASCLVNLG